MTTRNAADLGEAVDLIDDTRFRSASSSASMATSMPITSVLEAIGNGFGDAIEADWKPLDSVVLDALPQAAPERRTTCTGGQSIFGRWAFTSTAIQTACG